MDGFFHDGLLFWKEGVCSEEYLGHDPSQIPAVLRAAAELIEEGKKPSDDALIFVLRGAALYVESALDGTSS